VEVIAETPSLQEQIRQFTMRQKNRLTDWARQQASNSGISPGALASVVASESFSFSEWSKNPVIMFKNLLGRSNEITTRLVQEWQNGRMAALANSSESLSSMNNLDPMLKKMLTFVFEQYANRLSESSKKQIMSDFLGQALNLSNEEIFETIILNGGPHFQKLMQVVAQEVGSDSTLKSTLKKLESRLPPVSPLLVRHLLEEERVNFQWICYDLAPLGTGTMAEVHRGLIKTPNGPQDVVIRFLKPGIEDRVKEDFRILSEIAAFVDQSPDFSHLNIPKLTPQIQDIHRTITDELDLQATIARQEMGRKAYQRKILLKTANYKTTLSIEVPSVYKSRSQRLQVQGLAAGSTLLKATDPYLNLIPDLNKSLVEAVGKVWVEEMLFGSGFVHSDLHQGNFLVELTEPEVHLTLLDFGMGTQISASVQKQILLLGLGQKMGRIDLISRALWEMSEKSDNTVSEKEFNSKIKVFSSHLPSGQQLTINDWSVFAMNNGLKFPVSFVSLNRGIWILESMLKEFGSPLTLPEIAMSIAPKYVQQIFQNLQSSGKFKIADYFELAKSALSPQPMGLMALSCKRVFSQ
jgi:ubiquinone biosynthesis protein